jgi:hypothetical protein
MSENKTQLSVLFAVVLLGLFMQEEIAKAYVKGPNFLQKHKNNKSGYFTPLFILVMLPL